VQLFRKLCRRTTWLAMVALLAAALMPMVSHALGSTSRANTVQICTAQGMAWVQVGSADSDTQPAVQAGPFDHCPYCSLPSQLPALTARNPSWAPPVGLLEAYPERFYRAARTPQAWRSAQPRAPPPFS
jgi:hypothetical protein